MKYNTRFNPTVNGPLHIGHLYAILVNHREAQRSGGKFFFRFDDTQRGWNYNLGSKQVEQYRQLMMDDMRWLGIEPIYSSQAEIMPKVDGMLRDVFGYEPDIEHFFGEYGTELAGYDHPFYPYTDRLTAEKVIMDGTDCINYLIRGLDLITEDCLYKHFCAKFKMVSPVTAYIPRLSFIGGNLVSKTNGGFQLCQFREAGMNPNALILHLADDCLVDLDHGWEFSNVKPAPVVGPWAAEALERKTVYRVEHSIRMEPADVRIR